MSTRIQRLGAAISDRYVIGRLLGEGGMATVYLAEDVRHDRRVALKILSPEISEAIGPERFLREIRVTANLQHPHIVQLYDSGDVDGVLYYVMPFIEGESLRQKLDREVQLPVDEAVRIATAVAEALDYAHRQGVVHRDVKPENILLQDGAPLVSDFGIARAVSLGVDDRLTQTGTSLGTPSYMSPEQATGERDVDARSDIYSLGCVTYEMLAGEPPFSGSSQRMVIAKIVGERPLGLSAVRETVPAYLDAAVDRALQKVPADRFLDARRFADALGGGVPATGVGPATTPERAAAPGSWWWGGRWRFRPSHVIPAAGTAVLIGFVAWALMGRGDGSAGDARSRRTIRPVTNFVGWEWAPSFSPDGSMLAYSHIVGGSADVATIPTGGGDPHILTASSPADELNPAWSPDGSKIAYVSDRGAGKDVYWISPTGGAEHKVAETHIPSLERMDASAGAMGTNPWSPDSRDLLFSRLEQNGDVALWRVDVETGEQVPVTSPPRGAADLWGSFSSDGGRIVFTRSGAQGAELWILPSSGGEEWPLLHGEPVWGPGTWLPGDRSIAFSSLRSGTFNLWDVEIASGEVSRLTTGGGFDWWPAVARDGSLAYVQFGHQIDLYWLPLDDPGGEHERLTTYTGENFGARVSPDGGRILYYSSRSGNHDLWILDRASGQHRQLTTHPAGDRLCDWSPDGSEIVFMSDREGGVGLWVVKTETGVTRRLTDHDLPWTQHTAEAQGGPRWAPDGSTIGYLAPTEEGKAIWLVAPDGSGRRRTEITGAISFGWYRDGRRIVYTRRAPDGSGEVELRVAHLATGEDRLLRSGRLAEVTVSPDGRGLTFLTAVSHFTMEVYVLPLSPPASSDLLPTVAGEPEQVTFGEGVWHAHSGGWAPDGSGIVYSRDRDFGDIYLIEAGASEEGGR